MKNKKENSIDGLFRRKLNEEQLLPDDLLWNEIETRLDSKKPSRRFGIWLLLSAVLLCAVSSYFIFFNGNSNNNLASSESTISTKTGVDSNNISVNSDKTNSLQPNNSSPINSSATTTINSTSSSLKNNSTSENKNSSVVNKPTSSKKYYSENSSVVNKISEKPIGKNSTSEILKNNNSSETKVNSLNNSKNEIVISQTEISNSSAASQNETAISDSPVSTINSENNKNETTISPQIQNSKNENPSSFENKNLPDSSATLITAGTPEPVIVGPIAPLKQSKWFVEAGINYMNNSSSISADSSVDSYYVSRRNLEEQNLNTLNYKINVGATYNHLQLISGIELLQFGEIIQYENKSRCFTIEGNPTTGYDTLEIHLQQNNSISSLNGKSKNTYIGIPLKLNYIIPLKAFNLQLGVGTISSFPVKWNSIYLNKSVTDLENPSSLKMTNGFVFNINASAGILIPISKRFDASVSFDYRKNLTSVVNKSYSVNQKYQSFGTGISLRYNFIK